MVTPTLITQAVEPEPITYKRGTVYVKLTGLNAWLYRGMVAMYGQAEATERFWWLWHKKENSVTTPDNAVSSL
jgi:hypothetical protein